MERGTPVKTLSTTMSAEPVSAETFNRFVSIATAAANVVRNRPNPPVRVSWFLEFVNNMVPENFSRRDLDVFFDIFPNSDQLQPGEGTLAARVSDRIEELVLVWKRVSPILEDLVNAFEAERVAEQRVIQALPTTQPVAGAGVTPTEGTVGTAEGTRPVRPTIQFDYTYDVRNQNNKDELDEYIRVGSLIRSDAGYDNSPIGRLEKILIEGRPAVEEYLGRGFFLEGTDTLEHAFYAIAAPSYEGKTQSAFAFGTVKPLYFVMSEDLRVNAQPIYKNFESLSSKLTELSRMDIEHLKLSIPPNTALDQYISASSLLTNCRDEGFYVLGLFQALIIDGILNEDHDMSWMSYYVTTDRLLEIVPTSINEFLALGDEAISQFCIFLDEFTGTRPNAFIRNLARVSNLKVVVSNTNTNVTNLVGRPQGQSRIGSYVWSVVFTKLNSLNWNLLTEMVPDLDGLINYLKDHVRVSERSSLDVFFAHFKTVQVKKIRPGFVHLIIEAMREFKRENAGRHFNMEKFLSTIVLHLGTRLVRRKPSLNFRNGRLATLALFLANAYGPSLGSREDLLFHRKAYLQDHFYYLINPVQNSKFCFLTYRPGAVEPGASFDPETPLVLFKRRGVLQNWSPERTIFEQGEILVSLALMGIWQEKSIFNILEDANAIAQASPLTTGSTQNITQAVPSDGNALEVFSVVSLVDASHRNMNSSEITFTGQSGKSFLTNLIKNMISADNCRANNNYQVIFPEDGVTGTIISRIHVPYLFPANLPIPAMFSGLSSCAQYHNRSLHIGRIARTKSQDRIDCKFNFFLKQVAPAAGTSTRIRDPSQGICTVECKRYNTSNVNLTHLRQIFGNAQVKRANLCLLICNSVVSQLNPESSTIEAFKVECIAQKWEVLRLVQEPAMEVGQKVFRIERFHPDIYLPDPQDYKMTCIIIELEVLNA